MTASLKVILTQRLRRTQR